MHILLIFLFTSTLFCGRICRTQIDMFAITKPSAISGICVLGQGETKTAAWADAFGPRPTWSGYTKQSAKNSDCIEVTQEELDAMHEASANR